MLRLVGRLIQIGEILIALNLLALLIAAIAKRWRGSTAGLLMMSAWFWAVTLTVWCAAQVYLGWGLLLTLLGLALGIVGIVPVTALCFLFGREWTSLGELIFQVALVFGSYVLASRIMYKEAQ